MEKIYRVVCSAKYVPCKIVKTIFMPDTSAGYRENVKLDPRVPVTITSEVVNRFRPYIYVQGKEVASSVCNWLNSHNGEMKYSVCGTEAGYADDLYYIENDVELNFVYQRTFGLDIDKLSRIPLFYTTEGYLSLAVECLDKDKWKWKLDGHPTLENEEKIDEIEK